jgi:hypothetical protein
MVGFVCFKLEPLQRHANCSVSGSTQSLCAHLLHMTHRIPSWPLWSFKNNPAQCNLRVYHCRLTVPASCQQNHIPLQSSVKLNSTYFAAQWIYCITQPITATLMVEILVHLLTRVGCLLFSFLSSSGGSSTSFMQVPFLCMFVPRDKV